MEISKDHPRYKSLAIRERMAELSRRGIVASTGLIAHGRGEAYDYLLGERTVREGENAERVAAAYLLEASNPVISINGNAAALCAEDIISLAKAVPAKMEVNLFHRSEQRIEAVCSYMESKGANRILGRSPNARLEGIASDRALCTKEGIYSADVILVPLEDGDRAEALVAAGKVAMAIDLNPLSRTSRTATVSIVDEVTRAIPNIERYVSELRTDPEERRRLIDDFDNQRNLQGVARRMCNNLVGDIDQGKA
ncbi:MAG: phosphopantothenate/pantothenate synthetase [Methanomassiliicoccales archaeon]|nr:phosphopantothenate/pantothenate synthetase [Methanomassiliicoccales archaeon]NYT15971.1 phosphopantothenate/pantothenate synthetase [Methanomassiliicoccales archaeon]